METEWIEDLSDGLHDLLGEHMHDVADELSSMDFRNLYPVVDREGYLTGALYDCESAVSCALPEAQLVEWDPVAGALVPGNGAACYL